MKATEYAVLASDIEAWAAKDKKRNDANTIKGLAERIVSAEKVYDETMKGSEEIDTTDDIVKYLTAEPKGVLRFVENMGMNMFDYERSNQ